jgi:hypothetical protein
MGDSFQGTESVIIQPGDLNVPVRFRVTVATASTLNDGAIPYASTVKTVAFKLQNSRGGAASTMISSSRLDGNTVIAYLSYSSNVGVGLYHLTATITASLSGTTRVMSREFDLNRVVVRDV